MTPEETQTMLKMLAAPFDAKQIHWRVGSMTKDKSKAIPLAYLDARDVMDRLDAACGSGNWQAKYPFEGCCEISIFINGQWVTKANGSDESNVEKIKGQYSGAFKRAGVLWGIGRYLYDVPNTWVPVNEWKQFDTETINQLNERFVKWQTQYFANKKGA